jgi:hypothetical protein
VTSTGCPLEGSVERRFGVGNFAFVPLAGGQSHGIGITGNYRIRKTRGSRTLGQRNTLLPGTNAIGRKLSNARRLFIGPLNPGRNYISQFHELLVG